MIYTLTTNPAIDQIVAVKHFEIGLTNRAVKEYEVIGGKGINVSMMLNNLDYQTMACGFIGLEHQELFEKYLACAKIPFYFISVPGKVRTNLKIKSLNDKIETELNGLGFAVNNNDETKIIKFLKTSLKQTDCLIISGSIPQNANPLLYQTIAKYCFEQKILFVVDVTKWMLETTLEYRPFLIKPNLEELNNFFEANYSFSNLTEIIGLGKLLQARGAQNVLISMGQYGAVLISQKGIYHASSPQGLLVNSVGAGDSMVAGFIGKYLETKNYKQAFLIAICAGSATAFQEAIANKAQVLELEQWVKIKKISD